MNARNTEKLLQNVCRRESAKTKSQENFNDEAAVSSAA
jgi:hypothetical protein